MTMPERGLNIVIPHEDGVSSVDVEIFVFPRAPNIEDARDYLLPTRVMTMPERGLNIVIPREGGVSSVDAEIFGFCHERQISRIR
jgi:hypothetical protein